MITLCFILFGDADFNIQRLKINFDQRFKYLISYNGRDESEYLKFIESDFIKDNKNIHVYLGNKVYWGHISIVDSMVNIINKAKEIFNTKYAFIIDGKSILIKDYDYILNKLESNENINFFDLNQNWRAIHQNKKNPYFHRRRNMFTLFYLFRNFELDDAIGWDRMRKIIKIAKRNKKEYLKKLWKEKKYFEFFLIKKEYLKSFSRIFSHNYIISPSNYWTTEYFGCDPKIFFGKEVITDNDKDIIKKLFQVIGFNISGNLNSLHDFINSSIFKKNYEIFKNMACPEESIFYVAYTEYNKNWENEKSYAYTFRNSVRNLNNYHLNREIKNVILNESDPNDGYYFFYTQITNEKELNYIDNFLNKINKY